MRRSTEAMRGFLVLFLRRTVAKRTFFGYFARSLACARIFFTLGRSRHMARPIHHPSRHFFIGSALALAAMSSAPSARADRSDLVPETGFNYGEIETGRSAAMGGATRALGNAITGLYSNPANIALTRVYHLQGLAQIWPEARRQTYGASAVDSVTGRLAGAIGAHYGVLDPDGVDRKWTDIRVALGFPISERFYAGVTGKYLKLRDNGFPRQGYGLPHSNASSGLADDPTVDGFTFDAGITVKPSDALFIGVVGSNLTNSGNGFQPLTLGGGAGYGNNDITAEVDVVADFTTFTKADGSSRTAIRALAGFEYLAGDHFPLRLGYRYDAEPSTHAISGGFGYIDPQFSIDLAIRRTVSGKEPFGPVTTVVIDLQYFLESTGMTRSPVDSD
jgi:opacity protein-like surface antigen